MIGSVELWATMRSHLADDYINEYGENANCWSIAGEFYDVLGNEEQNPRLLRLQSEGTTWATKYKSKMIPIAYPNRIWNHHYICTVGDIVYDPMLEAPIKYGNYPEVAFNIGVLAVSEEKLWVPELMKLF